MREVLQAVDVPSGLEDQGDPLKRTPLYLKRPRRPPRVRGASWHQRTLTLLQEGCKAAIDYNHAVLSWAITDVNMQKTLNRYLMKEGLTREGIVMDPTTCALGYGIEFSIDVITKDEACSPQGRRRSADANVLRDNQCLGFKGGMDEEG